MARAQRTAKRTTKRTRRNRDTTQPVRKRSTHTQPTAPEDGGSRAISRDEEREFVRRASAAPSVLGDDLEAALRAATEAEREKVFQRQPEARDPNGDLLWSCPFPACPTRTSRYTDPEVVYDPTSGLWWCGLDHALRYRELRGVA